MKKEPFNWKEFLKPSWKKTILPIISIIALFIRLIFLGYSDYISNLIPHVSGPNPLIILANILFILFSLIAIAIYEIFVHLPFPISFKVTFLRFTFEYGSINFKIDIPVLLLFYLPIFWYFVSCFIIWIYSKREKKKKIYKKFRYTPKFKFDSEWKKFFKPELRRMVLFIILVAVEVLLSYFQAEYIIGKIIFFSIPLLFALFSGNKTFIMFVIIPLIEVVFLIGNIYILAKIVDLFYLYFISSMIINFYDMIRLKNLE